MATKSPASKHSEETFENAMARLEHIVEQMESEKLPLEELLSRYEEGVKLIKACEEKLTAAEKRIEIISRDSSGEPQIEEFEPAKKIASSQRDDVSLF